MYSPKPFAITDFDELAAFINENSFATLISNGPEYPLATHIPLYLEKREEANYLIGHASRANEQMRVLQDGAPVTIIFQGAHGYISSYAKDPKGMSILPTWDYQIVEVRGTLNTVDEQKLRGFLIELMKRHESNEPKQMDLDKYPQNVLEGKMRAIVGFEIEVKEAVGCFRLNQNRTPEERRDIISRLSDDPGNTRLIEEIKKINS